MTGLILFVFTILLVIIMVNISAIALETTGMTWQQAKFQALSCFTGTGFTTREAELITKHPRRRRIASIIIILGHAGDLSLIATFVNYLRTLFVETSSKVYVLPYTDIRVPHLMWQMMQLIIIIILLYFFHKYFFGSITWRRFAVRLRKRMKHGKLLASRVTFEELSLGVGDFGVSKIVLGTEDPYIGKMIKDSHFKDDTGAQILAIERNFKVIPSPSPEFILEDHDIIYCFGKEIKG